MIEPYIPRCLITMGASSMKPRLLFLATCLVAGLTTIPAFADSNATGGNIANSESVFLGAGPFFHADAVGDADNTIATATFVGGFNATHVRFSGDLTSIIGGTYGSEADIQVRQAPFVDFTWQNGLPSGSYTTASYDTSFDMGFTWDPAGTWEIEFIESFSDGPGADSMSENVTMTFEERIPISDSNGNFALPSIGTYGSASSVGELALSNLYDSYSITLENNGLFSFYTDYDPAGFTGDSIDTEIAIFDSAGNLVANNDDGGPGASLYSGIIDLALTAGDYTLVVAGYNTTFADGFSVTPGNATGDYRLFVTLTPEPSAAGLLFAAVGVVALRRRRNR